METLLWILACSLATLVQGQTVLEVDVCEEEFHTVIGDDRRSSSYHLNPIDLPLCDRFTIITGNWYRFVNKIGSRIPEANMTSCIPVQRCMTNYPIWLNGPHPTVVNETVTRTVCGNYGYDGVNNADKCCEWKEDVTIKLCPAVNNNPNFYVYQLVGTDACYIAYCGGTEEPKCEVNYVYENNSCVAKCPIQAGNPTLSDPTQIPSSTTEHPFDYYFSCTVDYPSVTNGLEKFEVTWLFNSEEDKTIQRPLLVANTGLVARINGTNILQHMGKTIECRVRSFRGEYQEHNMCYATFSRRYRMEIYSEVKDQDGGIVETPIELYEDSNLSRKVFFVSTVPPACPDLISPQNCPWGGISVVTHEGDTVTECKIDIRSSDWDNKTNRAVSNSSFEVKATITRRCRDINNGFRIVLHFKYINSQLKRYDIGDIQFVYNDHEQRICFVYNDPRIETFDNAYYDTQKIGQFYLVKSSDPSSVGQFEVQVRLWNCRGTELRWGDGSCVCAVAVSEGDTSLGIDYCNTKSSIPLLVQYSKELGVGAGIVLEYGWLYKICMPSGTCTHVTIWNSAEERRLNLDVFALPLNKGLLAGLCGNFDDDYENDEQIEVEDFRIPRGQSIFEGGFVPPPVGPGNGAGEEFELCTCEKDGKSPSIHCGDVKEDCTVGASGQQNLGRPLVSGQGTTGRRRKRDADSGYSDNSLTLEELAYEFDFGENVSGDTSHLTFPTSSGMTRHEAEDICRRDVESAVNFEDCLKIVGNETYDALVDNCIDDIRITDSVSLATSLWEILQKSCLGLLRIGVDSKGQVLTTDKEDGQGPTGSPNNSPSFDPKAVIEKMERIICPGRCNGNGNCVNGTCACFSGFIGSDCSLETGVAPKVTGIQNNGLCDVEMRPCRRVSMYSEKGLFSEVSNMKCKVDTAVVTLNTLSQPARADITFTNATFVTKWEIICDLPGSDVLNNRAPVSGFWVSLGFDDIFSDEKFVTIYDSVCMDCSFNLESCTKKKSSCLIHGKCYFDGELKEDDETLECKPSVSTDEWSKVIKWSDWSHYGDCSKSCDYGLEKSTRECLHFTCDSDEERTRICNSFNCPEIDEQIAEGVEITILATVEDVAMLEEILVQEASWAVNDYCKSHSTKCCAQFVDTKAIGDNHAMVSDSEHIMIASGFPKVSSRYIVFKIVPEIVLEDAIAQCSGLKETTSGPKERVYLDKDVLFKAIEGKQEEISENIGHEITGVKKSSDDSDSEDKGNSRIIFILVAAVSGSLLVFAVIAMITCFCQRRKEDHNAGKEPSLATDTGTKNMGFQ